MIRPATAADAPQIAAIWNDLIRNTTVTFTAVERSVAEIADLVAARAAADQPFLVAVVDGRVGGYATYGAFRSGPGYARTAEHSIHLAPEAAGRGIGRALMAAIEMHAAARGIHSMIGGVSAENTAGRAFHAAIGYHEVACVPEVGWKFGRWLDLVLVQKILT
jgi:phosphinothricin acetyltransferase